MTPTTFDFMGRRRLWFGLSAVLLLPGLVAILLSCLWLGAPVRLGLDFTGGTLAQLTFAEPVQAGEVREAIARRGHHEVQVTVADGRTALVRLRDLDLPSRQALLDGVKADVGPFRADRFESVGPTVGRELLTGALTAVGVTLLGIAGYVTLRYQLDFALCAIAALAHDVAFLVGAFALLGLTAGVEVDGLFVTALLTVVGFSVHDTIVVYDRLRENMAKAGPREAFDAVANRSIAQTLARSINTSLTVVLTLGAMAVLGGEPVRWFAIAMLLGVAMGTYSSIFNASQLLGWWRMRGLNRPKASPAL
jgi:preprotein translocase subunit SecF